MCHWHKSCLAPWYRWYVTASGRTNQNSNELYQYLTPSILWKLTSVLLEEYDRKEGTILYPLSYEISR